MEAESSSAAAESEVGERPPPPLSQGVHRRVGVGCHGARAVCAQRRGAVSRDAFERCRVVSSAAAAAASTPRGGGAGFCSAQSAGAAFSAAESRPRLCCSW